MDTSTHPKVWGYRREDFVEDKSVLMDRSRVIAEEGAEVLLPRMLGDYAKAEGGRPRDESR